MEELVVTEIIATEVYVECPNCGERVDGWCGNPRGETTTCEECNTTFSIHKEADVEMR